MLRMCVVTNLDKIENMVIRSSVGMAPIVNKINENSLRLFGHFMRRCDLEVVRVALGINVEGALKTVEEVDRQNRE